MKCMALLVILLAVVFANSVDKRLIIDGFHLGHTMESVKNYTEEYILTPGMETSACKTACSAALPGGAFYCGPACSLLISSLNGK